MATLEGNEAHHLLHVMRAQPGLELVAFDGQGGQFAAEVVNCKRSTVEISLGERQNIERELPFELTLAVPLPKGDRTRWLLEKSVELGVTRVVPLKTTRSIGKSDVNAKLTRYIIEASKQCGRNRLMKITDIATWQEFRTGAKDSTRLLAHPGGQPLADAVTRGHSLLAESSGLESLNPRTVLRRTVNLRKNSDCDCDWA